MIPVTRNQVDLNQQVSLIQPNDQVNQNFEYSKRIGMPAKRSTYMQNTRNIVDHSSASYTTASPANNNFYEREKQKIFKRDEMANHQPNAYQSNYQSPPTTYQHQPRNYGYIPSNNANHYDYNRNNQYDYTRTNVPYNQQYGNQPYVNQPYANQQYGNQPYGNQPIEPHQQYNNQQRDNSPDYHQQNDLFERELSDINLDNSFGDYDMPSFDQGGAMDNGINQVNFNDPMNLDSYFA